MDRQYMHVLLQITDKIQESMTIIGITSTDEFYSFILKEYDPIVDEALDTICQENGLTWELDSQPYLDINGHYSTIKEHKYSKEMCRASITIRVKED